MNNNFDRLFTVDLFKKIKYDRLKEFEDILELAMEICEVPIAVITLLDNETNHFVAKIGVDINSAPKKTSFCQYTIEEDGVMMINDTLLDSRFIDNPSVTTMGIRFYAGAALKVSNGYNIGSLCILDVKPKTLTSTQIKTLEILGRQAVILMELELGQKLANDHMIEIENQNRMLMNIAQVQSHDFRRPVASLLGLMNLIAEEDYVADKEYLLLMEEAVKELDEKIHLIVEYTNVI